MEIWRDILNYESYQVSNYGRVKSLRKEINHGNYIEISEEKVITNKNHSNGYFSVSLSKDGVKKNYLVHRLVADAFLSNPDNKSQVNHKNGNRKDNNIENLEWVTVSENHIHAFRVLNKIHPRHQFGKTGMLCKHGTRIYCPTLSMVFGSVREAGRILGLDRKNIVSICNGEKIQIQGLVFRYL